jgi:hypothetical protein
VRRNKGGRTEVEVVQRSEEEQGRKDRGGGGAEERGRTEVEVVQRSKLE